MMNINISNRNLNKNMNEDCKSSEKKKHEFYRSKPGVHGFFS